MRYFLIILTILTAFVFSACQTAQTQTAVNKSPTPANTNPSPPPADGAPRISLADAKAAFDAKTAVFIDTRPEDTYKQEHVKGAINITLMDDAEKYSSIPKGKKIIVYCS